jgi:RNA polymerase sigma-70 factor (ECF subfamily)
MPTTGDSLLQRLRQSGGAVSSTGDWDRFVELYTPLLYHWAGRLDLPSAEAADLVQDVFLRLVRKLPEFKADGHRSFRGWLHAVLVNCWRDQRRRVAPPVTVPPDALAEVEAPNLLADLEADDYRHYVLRHALRIMRRDFQPNTWQACWATAAEGRPAAEVAAELNMTPAAVYAATARVLRRLRAELAGFLE